MRTASPDDLDSSEDPRLLAALREYQAAVEAGRKPNRQELLARYPEIAEDLSACLQSLALVNSAAGQIKSALVTSPGDEKLRLPQPLGDFQLIREIGSGGMGTVYEATQLSLGRRVAVKVLPLASSLDPRQLQRFRNEAQAAAQLHHSNIVPVYAVGCERSVHFYAMQYIEGRSLADVIRAMNACAHPQTDRAASEGGAASGRAPSAPHSAEELSALRQSRRGAYFRAVANLGLQAAEALDYAHQLGVVHRDIKPANLLLDVSGKVWITDFGLAQCYADTGLTQTGDLVGTIRYMSPEQASGRAVVLDQRTDIYSLGVTLYEFLTLQRAVGGETREQLLHEISSVDPRPLRAVDRAIPAELETILTKATAKDAGDRYPSCRFLADDFRRFLADEPILARPPTLWDKGVKWTRRHKSVAASALAILLLAALGLGVTTLLIAREQARTQAAYRRERQRAREADEQRTQAQRSFQQARAAVDFFRRIAVEEMDKPQFGEVRKELLEAALDYYQGFLKDHADDPAIGAELSAARANVAAILTELAAFEDLIRAGSRMRLLREPAVQKDLDLGPEEAQKVQGLASEPPGGPGGFVDFRQLTSEQKRAKLTELTARIESSLTTILTVEQVRRLREISRQVRAPDSLGDSDVVEALTLTREQKDTIRAAQAQFRDAMRESFMRTGTWRVGGTNARELQQDAVKRILDGLSPTQASAWQTMCGQPFTGHFLDRGRPRPPEFSGPPDHDRPGPPPRGADGHDQPALPPGD